MKGKSTRLSCVNGDKKAAESNVERPEAEGFSDFRTEDNNLIRGFSSATDCLERDVTFKTLVMKKKERENLDLILQRYYFTKQGFLKRKLSGIRQGVEEFLLRL